MTLRVQNACGHGGTRLRHILVCAEHEMRPPVPLWLRGSVVAALVLVALCVSRFQMPGAPVSKRTIMDVSRLDLKAPPAHPRTLPPVEKPVPARQNPRTMYALDLKPPQYRPPEPGGREHAGQPRNAPLRHEVDYPAELQRPAIARASGYQSGSEVTLYPAVARERKGTEPFDALGGAPPERLPAARLRKEAGSVEVGGRPSPKSTYIYRVRGGPNAVPAADEPIYLPQRPARAVEVGGSAPPLRVAAVRSAPQVSIEEPKGGPVQAARQRSKSPAGSGANGSEVALARGVSLMSLKICDSALQQEESIKAVLSVVGSRSSCSSDKGEFQFKGTKRVSSFNLIIFPSRGREPSQRCEELEYAYDCLKKN
ncbi:hypothetical protein KOM00_13775 [Geomonas sp. Red69]|uniref:Uncharacterized protein n=1 Tax=Geomonas diazotrophica TaxID=2843197 RepID=A0ABX8JGS4_9BACT|nr:MULTISPECIES: hypothetical protein [Geomonas]MBU5637798.1 hypothetical protein [Geomonas diazotrophica]QWV96331.1 hypothetical protein KP005_13200 [Geomonas nitrogeniifigens]QXE85398.1 hypothetical protein KP003_13485 [Geomonas nitrogeniifigens]